MFHRFVLGVVFLPSIQMILTTMIVGHDPHHMTLGVANKEFPDWEERCMKNADTSCGADLSCRYLNELIHRKKDFFDLVAVKSEEEALEQVKLGKMWGYLSFPDNYTQHVGFRGAHGLYADNETLEGSIIKLKLDMSRE